MGNVSIQPCRTYETDIVYESLKNTLKPLGGMEAFVKKGEKVLVKPNLLMKRGPEAVTTTHPAVVYAVVRLVMESGGIVTIADSPGGPYTEGVLRGLYGTTGMKDVAEKTGAKLNLETGYIKISANGKTTGSFEIINPFVENDKLITVSKLKTHMMARYSGAVKNLFGLIPGTFKAEYHFRIPDKNSFSHMLLDLCQCAKPVLSVMDAVYGMEGDGPSAGEARFLGYMAAAPNPHELDYICCDLINHSIDDVLTLKNAFERKLFNPCDINVFGSYEKVGDFKKAGEKSTDFVKNKFLQRVLTAKPKVKKNICTGCGECSRVCPVKIIEMENKLPKIDYSKCITCFCCHELCPKKAMGLKGRGIWGLARYFIN